MALIIDRRRPVRVKIRGNVRGSLGLRGDVRVIDLSPYGAMIEHLERFSPGETIVLDLRLARLDLRLRARVAWCRVCTAGKDIFGESEILFRSGLQFLDLPERVETHIRHFLSGQRGPGGYPAGESE